MTKKLLPQRVASNLLDFGVTPVTQPHEWEIHHASLGNYFKFKRNVTLSSLYTYLLYFKTAHHDTKEDVRSDHASSFVFFVKPDYVKTTYINK